MIDGQTTNNTEIHCSNPKHKKSDDNVISTNDTHTNAHVVVAYLIEIFRQVDGSHGANKHVTIHSFPTIQQAMEYLRDVCHVTSVIGMVGDASFSNGNDDDCREVVEYVAVNSTTLVKPTMRVKSKEVSVDEKSSSSTEDQSYTYPISHPIHRRPFEAGNVCFSISKRHGGLPVEQARYCDMFVHIVTDTPVYNNISGGGNLNQDTTIRTAELSIGGFVDSQTCLSICLHHFSAFAGYQERDFVGQKFQVEVRLGRDDEEKIRRIREERRLQREKEQEEADAGFMIDGASAEEADGYPCATGGLFD